MTTLTDRIPLKTDYEKLIDILSSGPNLMLELSYEHWIGPVSKKKFHLVGEDEQKDEK